MWSRDRSCIHIPAVSQISKVNSLPSHINFEDEKAALSEITIQFTNSFATRTHLSPPHPHIPNSWLRVVTKLPFDVSSNDARFTYKCWWRSGCACGVNACACVSASVSVFYVSVHAPLHVSVWGVGVGVRVRVRAYLHQDRPKNKSLWGESDQ